MLKRHNIQWSQKKMSQIMFFGSCIQVPYIRLKCHKRQLASCIEGKQKVELQSSVGKIMVNQNKL